MTAKKVAGLIMLALFGVYALIWIQADLGKMNDSTELGFQQYCDSLKFQFDPWDAVFATPNGSLARQAQLLQAGREAFSTSRWLWELAEDSGPSWLVDFADDWMRLGNSAIDSVRESLGGDLGTDVDTDYTSQVNELRRSTPLDCQYFLDQQTSKLK